MVVPLGGFGKKLDDMYEWQWSRDIEAMRGCGRRDKSGRFYIQWCFADPATKKALAAKFAK
jgi:hypothetical protein